MKTELVVPVESTLKSGNATERGSDRRRRKRFLLMRKSDREIVASRLVWKGSEGILAGPPLFPPLHANGAFHSILLVRFHAIGLDLLAMPPL